MTDILAAFPAQWWTTVQLRRPLDPVSVAGKTTRTYAADVSLEAVVQPAKAKDVDSLPESLRVHDIKVFFARSELRVGEEGVGSDRIVHDGKVYELRSMSDWSKHGAFWRAVGAEVQT